MSRMWRHDDDVESVTEKGEGFGLDQPISISFISFNFYGLVIENLNLVVVVYIYMGLPIPNGRRPGHYEYLSQEGYE